MVHMYPLLHVVTYMTRIDYNPFNTTDCKGVRGSVDRVSNSRFESRRRQILFFIYREVYRIFSDFYLYSR